MMQAGMLGPDSRVPAWISLPSIDFTKHVSRYPIADAGDFGSRVKEHTCRMLDAKFEDQEHRPGWKIALMYKAENPTSVDVLLCWHHSAIDGMGAKFFHESLFRHLNDTSVELPLLENNILQLPPAERFPPSPEAVHEMPVTKMYALKTVWEETKPPFLVKPSAMTALWAPIVPSPYETKAIVMSINNQTVGNLLSKCRQHKTTITGLLHGLAFVSMAQQLSPQQATALSSISAVDLRKFMPSKPKACPWYEPNKSEDNHTSLIDHEFPADLVSRVRSNTNNQQDWNEKIEEVMWEASVSARGDIQKRIDKGLSDDVVCLMKFVMDYRTFAKQASKRPRPGSWSVTNIGVIDGQGTGEWKMERVSFELCAEVCAPVFHLSTVTLKGGDMCVDVSWQKAAVDEQIANRLASDVETFLNRLGSI